ncbi:hypothetical protein JTE90_015573 [Oedothorax gibbosus]|uniref:Eukaryotic translation initiation factor 3 subunit C N-terminal domain-containing protein n=1 Tax=Oedothorax gibbosus TaxID=931172 RepID=A0AAV6TI34_9ARAC|nr:hypothetical protein JTE90_015573 [Oedothorax gibbosus]
MFNTNCNCKFLINHQFSVCLSLTRDNFYEKSRYFIIILKELRLYLAVIMSRFFAVSDSESESSSSKEEQIPQKQQGISSRGGYKELLEIQKLMKNHKKIRDMSKLLSSFDDLTRAFVKAKNVIDKEEGGKVPTFYIRTLVELEDFISEKKSFGRGKIDR